MRMSDRALLLSPLTNYITIITTVLFLFTRISRYMKFKQNVEGGIKT